MLRLSGFAGLPNRRNLSSFRFRSFFYWLIFSLLEHCGDVTAKSNEIKKGQKLFDLRSQLLPVLEILPEIIVYQFHLAKKPASW